MNSAQLTPDDSVLGAESNVSESVASPNPKVTELWAAALAHEAAGQIPAALDACEACLRLDPGKLDAWFLLATLARRVGHHDFVRDVLEVVRALAPDEPRLAAFGEPV